MSARPASVAVEAAQLVRSFPSPGGGTLRAVDDLTFTAAGGELIALVGPDGAGKTTLMRMMAGLLRPDTGSLHVLGHDVVRAPQAVQDRISYMPQRFGLYEDLSVQENLDLYADLHGVPGDVRRARFARLLSMTDLTRFTARPAGKLSGGMKQKLGLACTLVRSPGLLLLDEPSVGVDPLSRRELWNILNTLVSDERLSVIVSTAYMDEAERCANVLVMNAGRLLARGTPQALRERAVGLTFTAQPPEGVRARDVQAQLLAERDLFIDAVPRGGGVRFSRQPEAPAQRVEAALAGCTVRAREATLEDAFMRMLREHEVAASGLPSAASAAHTAASAPAALLPQAADGLASATEAPVIVVRDLVRQFGDFTAVASTTFDVRRGEIFGLLGPNGAGKTTTFRMLCGLLPATSGHLEVAGLNLRIARAQARARIGYVSQKFALYGNLTVQENLAFFGGAYGLRGRALRDRIAQTLAQFQLDGQARSGELPAGYKQRLAMATGLLHRPEIVFLDEPTSGIDPLTRRDFWRTITQLAQAGVTIIVTTHFMEEAEYCDRIAIQDAGRMLALGTPQEVRAQAGGAHASDMESAFIAIVEQARDAAARAQEAA
ncbi:ATP-binding cassette domain-containing protein [Diaphorobacter sp.]|uniref:ATP-binding cassette domain-containing protein n=1 Tax=Diaphorobacter sp. TaxID=1934310 RepID=UPI003917E4F2